ncbi:MAG: hypothetical protein NZM02_02625 [Patescibacteria group bacterium]|nr:hypothetical protein [Patescibacteria group bacterium]
MEKSLKKIEEFYLNCADNYHNNKLSKYATRLGLIFGASLTLGAFLNVDNLTTKLNSEATLPLAGMTLVFFGIPILINFIRERSGYYNTKINK